MDLAQPSRALGSRTPRPGGGSGPETLAAHPATAGAVAAAGAGAVGDAGAGAAGVGAEAGLVEVGLLRHVLESRSKDKVEQQRKEAAEVGDTLLAVWGRILDAADADPAGWTSCIEKFFLAADTNSDGEMDILELGVALKELGIELEGKLLEEFRDDMDEDCNGTISLDEFLKAARFRRRFRAHITTPTPAASETVSVADDDGCDGGGGGGGGGGDTGGKGGRGGFGRQEKTFGKADRLAYKTASDAAWAAVCKAANLPDKGVGSSGTFSREQQTAYRKNAEAFFTAMDLNCDGVVNISELSQALNRLSVPLTPAQVCTTASSAKRCVVCCRGEDDNVCAGDCDGVDTGAGGFPRTI